MGWVYSHVFTIPGTYDYHQNTGKSVPSPGIWPVAVKDLESPTVSSSDDFNTISGLQLYPNPAIGQLNIISYDIIESVSVISLTGTRMLTIRDVHAAESVISLEGFGPGIYFVGVRSTDQAVKISRLVIR
jgi:hypothetical protein